MARHYLVSRLNRGALTGGAIGLMLGLALMASPAGASTSGEKAEVFIQDLAVSGVAMLENADHTAAQRETEFRNLVQNSFALEEIGRFVVGRYWRRMDPDQQAEYQEVFSEWLLMSYANRMGGYEGQRIAIARSFELDNRNKDVVVRTNLVNGDGQPDMVVDWRVRKFDGKYRIIDIIVEGISMAAAQKSEFEAVIRKVGVDGLVENLRSKLATMVIGPHSTPASAGS